MLNILLSFRPLNFTDIPLIHRWFNLPHIQKYYSLQQWTKNEVLNKLKPYIEGTKPVTGYIVLMNDSPIGYIQYYRVSDYPWPDQNLTEEIVNQAAGLDMFIGDEKLIGKGFGSKIVSDFLNQFIWPEFEYCLVDPDITNTAAIRCYEKINFREHSSINGKDALDRPAVLKLMILKR